MADVRQGVNYEITAADKTTPATDSALANLIRQEQESKKANERARKDAAATKGVFTAITNALAGNFQALAEQIGRAAARLSGLKSGPKLLGAIGFAATGVIAAVKGIAEAFTTASREAHDLEQMQLEHQIDAIGEQAKEFADEMSRARSEADRLRKIFDDEVQSVREMTKAQNELIKQQELAMAGTPEEREEIERRHARNNAYNDAYLDEEVRQREIADAQDEIGRLEKELAQAESGVSRARQLAQRQSTALQERENTGFFGTLWGKITDRAGFTANSEDDERLARSVEAANNQEIAAAKRVDEIRTQLEMARHRLEMANRREELAVVQDAATDQMDHNAEMQRIEERAVQAREAAEAEGARHIEEMRLDGEQRVKAERLKGVKAAEAAEADAAAARDRLAVAQAAVRQAWGWYRDKDSLKAQLEEEKANAAAETQFEKDFAKLTFRRDWRTAKNLSVDQEAVRRVGVAREEEAAARKAAEETAANTARAAEELAAIREAVTED